MEQRTQGLIQALRRLIGHHRLLLEAVRAEKEALVQADLKAIHESTGNKEAVLGSILQVERERTAIIDELALQWRIPFAELSLSKVIEKVQGTDLPSADQLRGLQNTLTVLIKRIREQNSENQALVEESLKHITEMKRNVLGEASPQASAYTRRGARKGAASGEARLIQREA